MHYSKLPAEDEQLIYSKHVRDIIGINLKKKVHLVGSYYANEISTAVKALMYDNEAMTLRRS